VSIIPSSFAWGGQIAMDADTRNAELGQVINYKGYLYGEYPLDDQIVTITIYEKETRKVISTVGTIPETKAVKYFENTAWPFTFEVSTFDEEFTVGKTYVVEAKYDDKSAKLDFFIKFEPKLACFEMLGNNPIIVLTDKIKYDQGDTIMVSGCLSKVANVVVYDPNGDKIGASIIRPNPDRTFSENFVIDKRFGVNGTYSLEVNAGGIYYSTKSFVVPEFGSVVMIILAVSFTLILFNKRVYRGLINFA
jgi:predicted secreted protein with PEFG-CTERM motif